MRPSTVVIAACLLLAISPACLSAGESLPKEFGDIVPVFNSARVTGVTQTRDWVRVEFTTPDPRGEVIAFYHEGLRHSGWRVITPGVETALVKGVLHSSKGNIVLTLTCREKQGDQPTRFAIQLNYPKGRE